MDVPDALGVQPRRRAEVAVVDTGVDSDPPRPRGRPRRRGYDFVDSDPDPERTRTATARTWRGSSPRQDNGIGIDGVAPGRLHHAAARARRERDRATRPMLAEAYAFAGEKGVRIVNAEPRVRTTPSPAEHDAIQSHPDTLFVVAAGNDGRNVDTDPTYPCAIRPRRTSSASARPTPTTLPHRSRTTAPSGSTCSLPATGSISTYPTSGYAVTGGTSMAAPAVSPPRPRWCSARDPGLDVPDVKSHDPRQQRREACVPGTSLTGRRAPTPSPRTSRIAADADTDDDDVLDDDATAPDNCPSVPNPAKRTPIETASATRASRRADSDGDA